MAVLGKLSNNLCRQQNLSTFLASKCANSKHRLSSTCVFSLFLFSSFLLSKQLIAAQQQQQQQTGDGDVCSRACNETYVQTVSKDHLNTTLKKFPKANTQVCLKCSEAESNCRRAQLDRFCPQFANSTTERLIFHDNNIGPTLNDSLKNLTSLRLLDLKNNRLTGVSRQDFAALTALEVLDLSDNLIRTDFAWDESMFADMHNLQKLSLNNLHITHIPATFFASNSAVNNVLTTLELAHNELTEVPFDALERIPFLLELDLSGNKIKKLTQTSPSGVRRVLKLDHLNVLKLSGLNIEGIDAGTFAGLPQLKTLILSSNSDLIRIDPDAFGMISNASNAPTLKTLDISKCGLKRLNESTVAWERLTSLRLDGNPWSCDCTMSWALTSWFLPTNDKLKNVDAIKCKMPAVNADQQMSTLRAEQMPCDSNDERNIQARQQHHKDGVIYEQSAYSPVAKFFIILFMLCISGAILGGLVMLYRRARRPGRNVPYRAVFNQGTVSTSHHDEATFADEDGLPSRSPYEI